jgi:hypothetical protein
VTIALHVLLDVYVMISMIFLCFKNLGLRNVAIAQASPVARLVNCFFFWWWGGFVSFSETKNQTCKLKIFKKKWETTHYERAIRTSSRLCQGKCFENKLRMSLFFKFIWLDSKHFMKQHGSRQLVALVLERRVRYSFRQKTSSVGTTQCIDSKSFNTTIL